MRELFCRSSLPGEEVEHATSVCHPGAISEHVAIRESACKVSEIYPYWAIIQVVLQPVCGYLGYVADASLQVPLVVRLT